MLENSVKNDVVKFELCAINKKAKFELMSKFKNNKT